MREIEQAYAKKLSESGLTKEDGKLLSLTLHQASTVNVQPDFKGVKIPYFTLEGKVNGHYRFRYLEDTRSQFDRLTTGKGIRYSQPANSGLSIYLPPVGVGAEWQSVSQDVTQPVVITEGEFKAACACKLGYSTIGLGGVWAFKVKDEPLPLLKAFKWAERRVFVVYDSDAVSNPQVNKAEAALCRLLGEWGAVPHIVRLPTGARGKQGLDDYLMAAGPDKFDRLLVEAVPYAEVQRLHELNERLIVIKNPSMIAERDTGYLMNRNLLLGVNYSNVTHVETMIDAKGNIKKKRVKTAEAWMDWPGRAEAKSITFAPGKPEFYDGQYNAWKGWPFEPDSKAGVKPWLALLDYTFKDNDPAHRRWFEQWCAYPLQHPGAKLATACVFFGVQQGTGKTFIGLSLKEIYGAYGAQLKEGDLHDDRNEWARNRQFILGDEVTGSDRVHMADRLKGMITQKEVRINPKYVSSYFIPDCINYYFTSNRCNAFILSGKDRRYFVIEMDNDPLPDKFYKDYEEWLYRGGGGAALFDYLLKLDLTGFNPQGWAPFTSAKKIMEESGKSEVEAWVNDLIENYDTICPDRDLLTASDVVMMFDPDGRRKVNVVIMGRVLKEAGVRRPNRGLPVVCDGKSHRLYIFRNYEKWSKATFREIVTAYTKPSKGRKF